MIITVISYPHRFFCKVWNIKDVIDIQQADNDALSGWDFNRCSNFGNILSNPYKILMHH